MKNQILLAAVLILFLASCGGDKKPEQKETAAKPAQKETVKTTEKAVENATKETGLVDLNNKGVGPIKSLEFTMDVDEAMAATGAEVYKTKCTSCHKANKRYIGPSPTGIFNRRSPEWVMNMILNPEGMVKEDPIAKALLTEYNGSPMANQNLTQDEARAVLEYFKTLK